MSQASAYYLERGGGEGARRAGAARSRGQYGC